MAYGFFDYWKNFNDGFDEHNLGALTQLVGYKLLAEFNKAKFSGISLTDRELKAITNIHSLKSIHDAKAQLKQFGLIDFKTAKNKPTIYTLCEPVSKHEVNTAYSNNTNNKTTEDVKTIRQEDINTTTTTARENFSIKGLCSEKVRVEWIKAKGVNPSYNIAQELGRLEQQHGTEKLVQAIQEADRANSNSDGINLNFVISHLNKIVRPKGDMRNGRSDVNAKSRRNAWDD